MDQPRPYVPAFLKKLDRKLLLKNPSVWSARTHLILYFWILFALAITAVSMLVSRDVRQSSVANAMSGFISLISVTGLVIWLIWLLRFNVFKRFGEWRRGYGLLLFLLYFLNVTLIVVLPFIPRTAETFMANRQYSDNELINDINEINLTVNRLEYKRLPLHWDMDTVQLVQEEATVDLNGDTVLNIPERYTNPDSNGYQHTINYYYKGVSGLESFLQNEDSVMKAGDSLRYVYKCPQYNLLRVYDLQNRHLSEILDGKEIFDSVIKNYRAPDRGKLLKRMEYFHNKYVTEIRNYGYDRNGDELLSISDQYKIAEMYDTMDTITEKKYRWKDEANFTLHFIFYAALCLSLLIFIFRHNTVKTFFFSVFAAVLIVIFTGLFIGVGRMEQETLYNLVVFYFIVFAAMGISVISAKRRTVVQGIGINFFMFLLPVIPLLLTASYYAARKLRTDITIDPHERLMHYQLAELIGFVLLLVLIEPLFRKLYRKWYAAPEE